MSATFPSAEPAFGGAEPAYGDGPPRWLAAVAGVLSVVVGVAALLWPGPTLAVIGFLFGAYLVIWGIGHLIRSLTDGMLPAAVRVLEVLLSVLAVIVGIALCVRPGASVATAALVLGFWWALLGVLQLVHGIVDPVGRVWNIVWGGLGILAGIIILASPEIALGTLVLIVGISLIVQGALELLLAFAPREGARA
jgi:uncharacterized membrane protein HdeD (DUF308 family)